MPSAASSAQREARRLASLVFFLDHQIGRYVVAEALRAAGAKVEVHLDHFPGDMPDPEWIPEVGRRDLLASVLHAQRGGSNVVLLTSLGGGAFGNDERWIDAAMRRALGGAADCDLDIRLVSYGTPSPEFVALAREFA